MEKREKQNEVLFSSKGEEQRQVLQDPKQEQLPRATFIACMLQVIDEMKAEQKRSIRRCVCMSVRVSG